MTAEQPELSAILGAVDDLLGSSVDVPELEPVEVPPTFNWRDAIATETEEQLEKLAEWVSWLRERYPLIRRGIVPDCWAQHGWLIEELAALHSAWLASYAGADAGYGGLTFHEHFATARARLREWDGRCERNHTADPEPGTYT